VGPRPQHRRAQRRRARFFLSALQRPQARKWGAESALRGEDPRRVYGIKARDLPASGAAPSITRFHFHVDSVLRAPRAYRFACIALALS
jgi:hypothetical protein